MIANARRRLHACGAVLHEMSRAQARWDIEMSGRILSRRKWAVIAAAAPVAAVLLLQAAYAADLLPEKIPILGGSKAYMPLFINGKMFLGSIFVGLIAGLITGVIGAGGGYILTPALMSFGVRGIMAVGTDQFHLFAKAIMGAGIHRKLGNVNVALAAWFVLGSVTGATVGGNVNRAIFQRSPAMSDALISAVYVLVLGVLGLYAVSDWLRLRRAGASGEDGTEATTAFAKRLQAVKLAPRVQFDQDVVPGGRSISVYPVIFCGLVVGFVAAIMGVGGGFLTFPMFVYGLGVSTFTTVGTDILQIVFTTSYSSIFQYAVYGFVFYGVAVGMLIGSLVGVQIGAMVTKMVKGSLIRVFYALTILAGFANRCCALPRKLADLGYVSIPRPTTAAIESVGTIIFFAIVGVFALWILCVFASNVSAMRAAEAVGGRSGLIRKPGKLAAGVAGLLVFAVMLSVASRPVINGQTVLDWADGMFNQLSKASANSIPQAREKAAKFVGTSVNFGLAQRDVWDSDAVTRLLHRSGVDATLLEDGRVRVTGDLGKLSAVALEDAQLAFENRVLELSARHDMEGPEVIYYWWAVFDGLTRRYVQEGRGEEAAFTKYMMTKILEPSYNFRGIEAESISRRAMPVSILLTAYVLFTIWYGVSILFIFEGLGISATTIKGKRET